MSGHSKWKLSGLTSSGEHQYLSTGCLHDKHEYCQADAVAKDGGVLRKVPAQCKFCEAPCICDCHSEGSPQERRLAAE